MSEEKLKKRSKAFHERYYPGWKVFETELPPHGRNVSWEAFVKYIAANNGDKMMNNHWRTQFNQCHICNVDYEYITHLENNSDETDFIFKKLEIENITHMPGRYSWSPAGEDELRWQSVPRGTAIKIYKHYFADFGRFE